MFKKTCLLLISIIFISGCGCRINQDDDIDRFYLDDKYYGINEYIEVDDLNDLDKGNYLLFTYNNYCTLPISCEKVFKEFMDKYDVGIVSIPFAKFRNTEYYNKVKYAPSILIIKEGEVIAYLDANSDEDLSRYQELSSFEKWLNNYIYFSKN